LTCINRFSRYPRQIEHPARLEWNWIAPSARWNCLIGSAAKVTGNTSYSKIKMLEDKTAERRAEPG